MARILEYIQKQIIDLEDTLFIDVKLEDSGFLEITKYISRNPSLINGGHNIKLPLSIASQISAEYGISYEYLRYIREESKKSGKEGAQRFQELVQVEKDKKYDKDIKNQLVNLYNSHSFEPIAKAMVKTINYAVLNNYQNSPLSSLPINVIDSNITFDSLPYGHIPSIEKDRSDNKALNIYGSIEVDKEVLTLLFKELSPVNMNLKDINPTQASRIINGVYNSELEYLKFNNINQAEGFIKKDNILFNLDQGLSCKHLTVETKVNPNMNYVESTPPYDRATDFSIQNPSPNNESCTTEELDQIQKKSEFIKALPTNNDFYKVEGVQGYKLQTNNVAFSELSRNFSDNPKGREAISVKLYFDKRKDVFAIVRSNDLNLALFCATMGDVKSDLVEIYFNPKTEEIYIVNKNKEQYGYCKGLIRAEMSNCEHIIYVELLKPSLSYQAKYNLFLEENIMPVVMEDRVIRETKGLEDAISRQNFLLSIDDRNILYDLLIRNIGSYVYSYATQVKDDKGKIQWQTKKSKEWGEGDWIQNENGQWRWTNPNLQYIYRVEETFWTINSDLTIEETLAYFVSQGGASHTNSSYYRKLSQRILGVDYYLFADKITPKLLELGLICIEDLDFDNSTGALKQANFSYLYDYASGDVYGKMEKLQSTLTKNIKLLYGETLAAQIVSNQYSLLQKSFPTKLKFGDKNPSLNLIVNIHNPIFYNHSREGFVSRIASQTKTLKDGQIFISTTEKFNDIGTKYKEILPHGEDKEEAYKEYTSSGMKQGYYNKSSKKTVRYGHTRNHLQQFALWIQFGKGGGLINKEYITEDMIIDGYVYPKGAQKFVPMYIMPTFKFRETGGKDIDCPLKFYEPVGNINQFGKRVYPYHNPLFSQSTIYDKKSDTSSLTDKSRENLIKVGLMEDKPKVPGYDEVVQVKGTEVVKKIKVIPLDEFEGKKIYNIILAKYQKLESEIKTEGDRLFSIFCWTQLQPEYRKEIEETWNRTYNNLGHYQNHEEKKNYSKTPIFCEHSRWFGNAYSPDKRFLFELRDAQVEGIKFSVANQNTGLLAHEVGFGKTTTSIALISHMNLTGESPRTLVFTPKQVFLKFNDEITGNKQSGVLGLLGNWKKPYQTLLFDNATPKTIMEFKDYQPQELKILESYKNYLYETRKVNGKNRKINKVKESLASLPVNQPRIWTDYDGPGLTDNHILSDIQIWWDEFLEGLELMVPEAENYPEVGYLLSKIQEDITKAKTKIDKTFHAQYHKQLYTAKDFKNKTALNKLPKYVKRWWKIQNPPPPKQIKGQPFINPPDINWNTAPSKTWITDIDGAVEEGLLSQSEAKILKDDEKNGIRWDGILTKLGVANMMKEDNKLSNTFFKRKEKTGSLITKLVDIGNMLYDELGTYKKYTKKPNTIILCSHQAIKEFRVTPEARRKAQMFASNVDAPSYSPPSMVKKFEDKLSTLHLSLMKLNITSVVVDEIHNFNNVIQRPRPHDVTSIRYSREHTDRDFALVPSKGASAKLTFLPDGTSLGTTRGLNRSILDDRNEVWKKDSPYRISYNSTGAGTVKDGPANLLSIIFQVQQNAWNDLRVEQKNSIMLSATPFTDNVFQMFTVLGLTNVERMKQVSMDKVFDFFITFVKEEWRYNITHKNKFGLFSEIEGYYNTAAMSNFINAFANFKISDKKIEKSRPVKYIIPQEKNQDNLIKGNLINTSSPVFTSLNTNPALKNVSSYIELTDIQKYMINKISQFVQGDINSPYEICPNYNKAVKVSKTGGMEYISEDIQERIEYVTSLMKKSSKLPKDSDESNDLIIEANNLASELNNEFPKDKIIAELFYKTDDARFGSGDEKEKVIQEFITDVGDLGFLTESEEEMFKARAILGQGYGQKCVLSPYLLKCDRTGDLENELLKDYPLLQYKFNEGTGEFDKNGKEKTKNRIDEKLFTQTAKNFVEQSPKIYYGVKCALNSIEYNSKDDKNNNIIGGQIIYLNQGKNLLYGGNTYNAYELIKRYIIDQKFIYRDKRTNKTTTIGDAEVQIITGAMGASGKREEIRDEFNNGNIKILIGSSAIQEGIDLHKQSHTLYVLDSNFSPSNAMQLEGRIWRQGNAWKNVRIVYVLGKDSIDAFIYSKLQQKINEIKKMLEAGVYEMNKTQFTINAKERIREIITDIDQLVELAWQDRKDDLEKEMQRIGTEIQQLENLKLNYPKINDIFKTNVILLNHIYALLIENEKTNLANKERLSLNIQKEYDYRFESSKKGAKWTAENPFKTVSLRKSRELISQKIKDGELQLSLPNIMLTTQSKMEAVEKVVERVREAILFNQTYIIEAIKYINGGDTSILEKPESEQNNADKLLVKLYEMKDWKSYNEIEKEVSLFGKGSDFEIQMNNFDSLVSLVPIKSKGVEKTDLRGKKIFHGYNDIEDMISDKENEKGVYTQQLQQEEKFREEESEKIKKNQQERKSKSGKNVEELILNFNKSMVLLERR